MALCFTFQQTGKCKTQWVKENFGCPWASCVMNWMVEGHPGDSHHMLTFQCWAPQAKRYLHIKDPLHNCWNEGITRGVYLNNFQAYPCQTIMIHRYLEVSAPKHLEEVQQAIKTQEIHLQTHIQQKAKTLPFSWLSLLQEGLDLF